MLTITRHGNLGNLLFQYASALGLAAKHNHEVIFPEWPYANAFEWQPKIGSLPNAQTIKEAFYEYHEWPISDGNYNLDGYLQSAKYWEPDINIKELFKWRPSFYGSLRDKFSHLWERHTIGISIRRGDYVGNENYSLLPITYYLSALIEHFPNWKDFNIVVFTDDFPYARIHFECLENVTYAQGLTPIEQLCIGSMMDNLILSNSTFAWWMGYLSDAKKIIRPVEYFAGPLAKRCTDIALWPDQWTPWQSKKLDLTDHTFLIPVFHDHRDRKQNLDLSICMLQRDINSNFIIGEQGSNSFGYMEKWATYRKFNELNLFHRTRMLNQMTMDAETPFIVNWDCDMFIPPLQLWLMAETCRSGQQMVYPFDGRVSRIPRQQFTPLEKSLDLGSYGKLAITFAGKNGLPQPTTSVGHAVAFEKEAFIEGGMENENFLSYGPEDSERWHRFQNLGLKTFRIKGTIYHMEHFCGPNSSSLNPHFQHNSEEHKKVLAFNRQELRAYVDSWRWVHKYTEGYYRKISEGSKRSASIVYEFLDGYGVHFDSVLDVGCGCGEWKPSHGEYKGIDFGVPAKSLTFDRRDYVDCDLTLGFPIFVDKKFDLALCLEVAEHLPEQSAIPLVDYLCLSSNMILWSAAIPYQPGAGHINCQWQSYWAARFAKEGFYPLLTGKHFRHLEGVEDWYRNNLVLYGKPGKREAVVENYILPEMYENIVKSLQK